MISVPSRLWPRNVAVSLTSRVARVAVLTALVTGLTVASSAPPAQAAAATHLKLVDLETGLTVDRDTDAFSIQALDGAEALDVSYTGTVTFSATCGDCFEITPHDSGAGNEKKYTFNDASDGWAKDLTITWKSSPQSSVGDQDLTVAAPGLTSGVAYGIAVSSNAAVAIRLENVDSPAEEGIPDSFRVYAVNNHSQPTPEFTGTVTFSAAANSMDCGDCFSVSPHDGGAGNDKKYTFISADAGTKDFSLVWKHGAVGGDTRLHANPPSPLSGAVVSGISVNPAGTSSPPSTTTTVPAGSPAQPMIVTGAGAGGGPHVIARTANSGALRYSFFAYDPNFHGGVRVATGDVNGDGYDDIITAPGPGGGPHIRVFSGKAGVLLGEFMAYATGFSGGVFVAAADVNSDGKAEIVTGPDAGGGPHVKVFSGASPLSGSDGSLLGQFMAYPTSFHGGVRVAAGDFDNDGGADIVTGAGPGGGPHVRVLRANGSEVPGLPAGGFFAYAPTFTGGVHVAAGRLSTAVMITGAGAGGGRHVRIFDIHAAEKFGFIASGNNYGAVPAIGPAGSDAAQTFVLGRVDTDPTVQKLSTVDGHQIDAFVAYGATVGVWTAVGVL